MLLPIVKCSYNVQVIPRSNSTTTFYMLPFYTQNINKASIMVRLIKIMYISSLISQIRIILRQSAVYAIPTTVSGLLDKSEVCALTNDLLFFSLRGLYTRISRQRNPIHQTPCQILLLAWQVPHLKTLKPCCSSQSSQEIKPKKGSFLTCLHHIRPFFPFPPYCSDTALQYLRISI